LLLASIGAMAVPAVIPRHEKSRCVASAPTMTRFLAARGPE
jgi:hypothetical protein